MIKLIKTGCIGDKCITVCWDHVQFYTCRPDTKPWEPSLSSLKSAGCDHRATGLYPDLQDSSAIMSEMLSLSLVVDSLHVSVISCWLDAKKTGRERLKSMFIHKPLQWQTHKHEQGPLWRQYLCVHLWNNAVLWGWCYIGKCSFINC